jgi:hypothetical protein
MWIMTGDTAHLAIVQGQGVVGSKHSNIHHMFPGSDAFGMAVGAESGKWFYEVVGTGCGRVMAIGAAVIRAGCHA